MNKLKKSIAVALAFVLTFCLVPSACAGKLPFIDDPQAINDATYSVVKLTSYDDYGPLSSASGVAMLDDGIIVTNYHVIEDGFDEMIAETEGRLFFYVDEVLAADAVNDIAILRTFAEPNFKLLQIGNPRELLKGSKVIAIGSPDGFNNTVSSGMYSGYVRDSKGIDKLQFDASIYHGSSGGALFDNEGNLIGITSSGMSDGSNINFAVPIEKVTQLWDRYLRGDESVSYNIISNPLNNLILGKTVSFGKYEQDNNITNGPEPIEWIVVATEDDKALLVSDYAIECLPFDSLGTGSWYNSEIREWLNGSFLNETFDADEIEQIAEVKLSADINPKYPAPGEKGTNDRIFLLSINEVNKYFLSDESRITAPTDHASYNGVWGGKSYTYAGRPTCWWWLRTPGYTGKEAAVVNDEGEVDYYGSCADSTDNGVRPAMWVRIPQ